MFSFPSHSEDEQILEAAKDGDLKRLQELRNKAGGNVAFRQKCELVYEHERLTCLHVAAERGNIQICRFLIEKVKMNIDIKTDRGETPLLLAALKGQFGAAKYFIIRGADVDMGDYHGTTCLHVAAENGNKEIMQLLLLKDAEIEAHSVRGTPLQCAASCASVESVRFLLSRGADPNEFSSLSDSSLVGAILCRSHESLKLLLKAGADPTKVAVGLSPLAVAAMENDTQSLRILLGAGANPNRVTSEFLLPIEYAAKMGNTEGLKILFEVTWRCSYYPDWSIRGIQDHVNSEIAKAEEKQDLFIWLSDETGKAYVNEKDYGKAVEGFDLAISLQPENARFRSNRSLCWLELNEPHFALHDAEATIRLKPDWPEAHYRAGAAWMALENYNKALASFKKASVLDPENMEIKEALSLARKHCTWWW